MLIGKPNQNARLTFSGTAGQYVHLQFMGVTILGTSSVTIQKPDSTTLASTTVASAGVLYDVPQLPTTGTYTVVVDPAGTNTGTATILLTGDITGTLVDGAAPLSVNLSRDGQKARLTFTGAVGQNLGIGINNLTFAPGSVISATVSVLKPDTTPLLSQICYSTAANGPGCQLNLNSLPAAGTYSVLVQPPSAATSSFGIQLNSDVTGTLPANTALPVSLKPGQNARLNFTGAVGDSVALEFAQVSTIPAGRTLYAYVYRPTDTVTLSGNNFSGYWQYVAIPNTGATLSLPVLPAAGSYKVVLDTTYQETANVRVTLEAGTVLTIDASATSATIANAGETARFTFTGALGQNLGLGVSNLALVPTSVTYGYVYVWAAGCDAAAEPDLLCHGGQWSGLSIESQQSAGGWHL